jgi:hypothetical protein
MTASRPFATGSAVHSWDSQASATVSDVSHLHTEYLEPPAYVRSPMPPEVLSHPTHPTHVTQVPRFLHPPLPAPELPSPAGPAPWDPWTAAMKEHLRAAQRLHEEADQLHHTLTVSSAQANAASQRWFTLMHTQQRTPEHALVCAQLEGQILAFSRQLASLRQRWTTCMTQAREHEETARLMQPTSYPRR